MKSVRLALILAAITLLAGSAAAHAVAVLATRTWVSGAGSDSNPCSRTAPCLTWGTAISKTAPAGEVDALDPGDFGLIQVTQSITIDGGGGQVASVLVESAAGVLINSGANSVVTLRNLRFQGALGSGDSTSTGISVISVGKLHIENCIVAGMGSDGLAVDPSVQPAAGSLVFISNSTFQDNGGEGIFIGGSLPATVHVTISNSLISGNGDYGLYVDGSSRVTVRNTESSGNAQAGFIADAYTGNTILSMFDSVATNNLNGGVIAGGGAGVSTIRIANMGVFNNGFGYSTGTNGSIVSFGNNNNSGSGTPNGSIPQD